MRKLVLVSAFALVAGSLAACSSAPPGNPGSAFDNGSAGASSGTGGGFSSGTGGGTSSGTGGGTGTTAPYPALPYGTETGSTIANMQFYGWTDPVAAKFDWNAKKTIQFSDYYDPDGSKGDKVILLNSSAYWCTVCQAEYGELPADYLNKYKAEGVVFIGTLFEDANQQPAQHTDLINWSKAYQVPFPMLLDSSFKLGTFFTADATPMNLVIDARNMKIVDKVLGGDLPSILQFIDSYLQK